MFLPIFTQLSKDTSDVNIGNRHLVIGQCLTGKTTHVKNILYNKYISFVDNVYVFTSSTNNEYYDLVDQTYNKPEFFDCIPINNRNLIIIDELNTTYGYSTLLKKYEILKYPKNIVIYVCQSSAIINNCNFNIITCSGILPDNEKQKLYSTILSSIYPSLKIFMNQFKLLNSFSFIQFEKNGVITNYNKAMNVMEPKRPMEPKKPIKTDELKLYKVNYTKSTQIKILNITKLEIANNKPFNSKYEQNIAYNNIKIKCDNYEDIKSVNLYIDNSLIYTFNHNFIKFNKDWVLPFELIYDDNDNVLHSTYTHMTIKIEFKTENESSLNYWKLLSRNAYICVDKIKYINKGENICKYAIKQRCYYDYAQNEIHKYELELKQKCQPILLTLKFFDDSQIKNIYIDELQFTKVNNYWILEITKTFIIPYIIVNGDNYIGFSLEQQFVNEL